MSTLFTKLKIDEKFSESFKEFEHIVIYIRPVLLACGGNLSCKQLVFSGVNMMRLVILLCLFNYLFSSLFPACP